MSKKSNTKIRITPAEDISLQNSPMAVKIGFKILSLFILFCLLTAVGTAINFSFSLELPVFSFRRICFFISLWGLAVFYKKKWTPALLTISIVIFCGFCCKNYELLLKGGKDFLNHIFFNINYYYQVNIPLFDVKMAQKALSLFFSAFLFIPGMILSFGIMGKIRPSIPISVSAFVLIGGLMVGRLPNEINLVVFFFCCFIILSMNTWQHTRSFGEPEISLNAGFITAAVFLLCIFFSLYLAAPKYSSKLRSYHDTLVETEAMIEEKIISGELYRDLFHWGRFGIMKSSPGTLSNQTPKYQYTSVLKVSVEKKPEKTLYLKGWVGSDYNGRGWEPVDEEAFYNAAKKWQIPTLVYTTLLSTDTAFLVQNLGYSFAGNSPEKIEITPIQRDKDISYAPYFCKYDDLHSPNAVLPKGDGRVFLPGNKSHIYEGYPFYTFSSIGVFKSEDAASEEALMLQENNLRMELYTQYEVSEEALMVQELYLDYINGEYKEIPEENLTTLKEICDTQQLSDVGEITEFIASFLLSQATYNLSLSPLPLSEDFVDYFLFQQKKGFCTHFASSATLMYRMFGVPARYVSGYIVKQEDFTKKSENQYEALVPDNNSHAWTEIYIENVGWVPMDFTPGFGEVMINRPVVSPSLPSLPIEYSEPDNLRPDSEGIGPSPTPSNAPASSTTGSASETQPLPAWVLSFVWIPLGSAGLFFFLLLRRFIILFTRKRLLKKKDYNKALETLSHSLYAMARTAGYASKKYKSDREYGEDMCLRLSLLAPNSLPRYTDFTIFVRICQKSVFSKDAITHDEFVTCHQIYRRVVSFFSKRQTGLKKFYWKYIRCFS